MENAEAGDGDQSQIVEAARLREVALLRDHPLFDPDWYLAHYPDVLSAGLDAADHFVRHGWEEGRDPGPGFSTLWYLAANPDVAAGGLNPLVHYSDYGLTEGRLPHPDALPVVPGDADVASTGIATQDDGPSQATDDPDIALVEAHRLFDARWYAERAPGLAASGLSPAAHFVRIGGFEGRSPGPDFDLLAYLDAHDEVERTGTNPFVHFLRYGEQPKGPART